MTPPTYTLDWILPFVRQALKGTGNLEYSNFVNNVWLQLEKAQTAGVERHDFHSGQPGTFNWASAPWELKNATNEAFFFLFRNGYIIPQPPSGVNLNHPTFIRYDVTPRGHEWAEGNEPLPEDIAGYMKLLHQRVPNIDSVIDQYVAEAVRAFNEGLDFAAAVMLGAASEKALYLLADDTLGALKSQTSQKQLQKLMSERKLNPLLVFVRDALLRNKAKPGIPLDGATTQLMALFDAIRTQRNDAVHPTTGQVSAASNRHLIASLPYALSKCEEMRDWLRANPQRLD